MGCSHWPPLCGPPSHSVQAPSGAGTNSVVFACWISTTRSHFLFLSSVWEKPFTMDPFRGQLSRLAGLWPVNGFPRLVYDSQYTLAPLAGRT